MAYVGNRATALKLGIGSKKELNAEKDRQALLPQIQQGITVVQQHGGKPMSKALRLKTHHGYSRGRKKPNSVDSRANDLIF